jgi:hypothetical protein
MNKGLSHLRLKKVRELLKSQLGFCYLRKNGEIRYGRNLIDFMFRPERTSLLEFFTTTRGELESTIDNAYSKFILGEYNLMDQGADFKFNTIRNVFKDMFRTDEHMVNHYAHKLSLPMVRLLEKQFPDKDILNLIVPVKATVKVKVRNIEDSIYDYVKREFNLVRAGPNTIRLAIVA